MCLPTETVAFIFRMEGISALKMGKGRVVTVNS